MTAIFGIRHPGDEARPVDPAWIAAMDDALAGCGPHGDGTWQEPAIALGARLLHDTPEALFERQPLAGAGGDVLVADARIDNRDELHALLELPSGDPAALPDSAFLLAAWERWGEQCCAHLEGDFAFAIWSARDRALFCARSAMGVKPFYYSHLPGRLFAFASQLAGLLALEAIPRVLDRTAAGDALVLLTPDHERTLFADIRRLAPGHCLTLSADGQVRKTCFWSPEPQDELRLASEAEYAAAMREHLERAVRERVRAAGSVGAHLSGGLDSSAMVCLAARALEGTGTPLTALSFSEPPRPDGSVTDAGFIAEVADLAGVEVRHSDFEPEAVERQMEESAPGMMPPEYETSGFHRWAAGEGLRVILSGWGGDEAPSFNGRGYLPGLLRSGHWVQLARVIRGLRRNGKARSLPGFLFHRVATPVLPDALWWLCFAKLRRDPFINRVPVSCASPELVRSVGLHRRVRRHMLRERVGAQANQLMLLQSPHIVRRTEGWSADAARCGIDYRYPLLDRRLLEFCLSLPANLHIRNGIFRYLFRKALEGHVPASVLGRLEKVDSWRLRSQDPVRGRAQATHLQKRFSEIDARNRDPLGGCVSLDLLRRGVAQARSRGAEGRRIPALSVGLAMRLIAFAERNGLRAEP